MSRVVVTGGAGLVGSCLVEALIGSGYTVTVVDNLSTGDAEAIHHAASFERVDVCEWVPDYPFSAVVHLASPAAPNQYRAHPGATIAANVTGTEAVLSASARAGARAILASSSEIYGDFNGAAREFDVGAPDMTPDKAPYVSSKIQLERLGQAALSAGLSVSWVRLFNVYGHWKNDGRAVPSLIDCARSGQPMEIHGDGNQTRSFCWAADAADALVRLIESDTVGPLNIGNPEEVSIRQLAETVADVFGATPNFEFSPPQDQVRRRLPSIERATSELMWRPQVSIRDGLQRIRSSLRCAA